MDDKPRKRGRPPKPTVRPREISSNKKKDSENIVLFLALSESDNSEANNFTINDTEIDKKTKPAQTKKVSIQSVTESDDVTTSSSDEVLFGKQFNSQYLIGEIKKRDQIITNLKSKIGQVSIAGRINVNYHSTIIADNNTENKFVPQQTKLHCWWCDHTFDTLPIYIPTSYKNGTYYVFGNFCSFNCAGRYNSQMLQDYKCSTRNALLHSLKEKITGSTELIRFAPMRELLTSKGGNLSIEEFRKGFLKINPDILISMPPLIPMIHSIENVGREI